MTTLLIAATLIFLVFSFNCMNKRKIIYSIYDGIFGPVKAWIFCLSVMLSIYGIVGGCIMVFSGIIGGFGLFFTPLLPLLVGFVTLVDVEGHNKVKLLWDMFRAGFGTWMSFGFIFFLSSMDKSDIKYNQYLAQQAQEQAQFQNDIKNLDM